MFKKGMILITMLLGTSLLLMHVYDFMPVYLKDEGYYLIELGQATPNNPYDFLDPEKNSPLILNDSYQIQWNYQKEDLINEQFLKVGVYQGTLSSQHHSIEITLEIVDRTKPTLTLSQSSLLLKEEETISDEELLNYLTISDLSEISSTTLHHNIDYTTEGNYNVSFVVEDCFGNQSEISLEVIVPKQTTPSFISSSPTPSQSIEEDKKEVDLSNICPNGNQKMNPNKSCKEPAYDEFPDKIGSLEELQTYANEHQLSHFITNITLNDGTETYGLWITD